MMIPPDVSTDGKARAAFRASTLQGFGPRTGSRPIGWYQQAHDEAWRALEAACVAHGVPLPARITVRRDGYGFDGDVYAGRTKIGRLSHFSR